MKKLRTRRHAVVLNRSRGGDVGITIVLALMGAIMVLPLIYMVMQSLKPLDEFFVFPPRFYVVHPTLNNFRDLFFLMSTSWVPLSRYLFNTVFTSVAGTFGQLILASLAAYVVAKMELPGRKVMFQMIQKSLMFSATVAGTITFVIMRYLGWVDTYLAVIVPAFQSSLGLYLMKQFMETNVSQEMLESARLDGAKEFRIFWSIAMPMVKPAWLTLIIYAFKDMWTAGGSSAIYSEQLKSLNTGISQIAAGGIARQGISAASTLLMAIVPIIVFVVSQSNVIETMGSSGMKD
ncbi:MAG: carbohydrate ABC transporter permease [Clostridia bacterium]|nr:carbohydrate ABC transporter permease [Clostridia bacterium]